MYPLRGLDGGRHFLRNRQNPFCKKSNVFTYCFTFPFGFGHVSCFPGFEGYPRLFHWFLGPRFSPVGHVKHLRSDEIYVSIDKHGVLYFLIRQCQRHIPEVNTKVDHRLGSPEIEQKRLKQNEQNGEYF